MEAYKTHFIFQLMDKCLAHFAGPLFDEEVRIAKQQFFDNAGILEENSPSYELRMCQFFDWYFFTRLLTGYGHTVLNSLHQTRELRFLPEEEEWIASLKKHRHSLFEFLKIKGDDVYLRDLLNQEKLVVTKSPYIYGFDTQEIFEARLIPLKEGYLFCRGFCFHPGDAKKFILSQIKIHKKNPDLNPQEMMLRLLKMRYKFERYKHVKINDIYSNENKVGL